MRRLVYSGQFRKDFKRSEKRGKDMQKLRVLIDLLVEGATLPPAYRDHSLKGVWFSFRDAHIEPDWLLIYRSDGVEVRLERMGSHADLFE